MSRNVAEKCAKVASTSGRPSCRYGASCYRKNPSHFAEFDHPPRVDPDSPAKRYGFSLIRVQGLNYDAVPSVSIEELLGSKPIKESVQFNYMFDIPWLMKQYPKASRSKPLTVVHGFSGHDAQILTAQAAAFPNVALVQAPLPIPFGTHHTKMMWLRYEDDSVQIVIHTANMIEEDWACRTQGVYATPLLAPSEHPKDGETAFRRDLLDYLDAYGSAVRSKLDSWVNHLQKLDFSPVAVFLVASVPGRHQQARLAKYGHVRLGRLLSQEFRGETAVPSSWPLIGQFSSIGSLGPQPTSWLKREWSASLTCKSTAGMRLIFPTVENVRESLEGYRAGGCLPFFSKLAAKQAWLTQFLFKWDAANITRAIPHLKSYCRIDPKGEKVAWFLLTSANLSKAAWGQLEKKETQLFIRSYELGVLFIPRLFDVSGRPRQFILLGKDFKPWLRRS